jgi:hypothetical protein
LTNFSGADSPFILPLRFVNSNQPGKTHKAAPTSLVKGDKTLKIPARIFLPPRFAAAKPGRTK